MGGIYWLASYPKSGNTWFRSFLMNLLTDGDKPADINQLTTGRIASARGWLDEALGFPTAALDADEIDQLRPEVYRWTLHDKDVGYHKIHDAYTTVDGGEPLTGSTGTRGVLYILRNPLDIVPSYANHNRSSLDEAIAALGDHQNAMSQYRFGLLTQTRQRLMTWSEHVSSWVDAPGLKRQIIRYEDMLETPVATFSEAARFLGLSADVVRIEKAIRFSAFAELSRQEREAGFEEKPPRTDLFFRNGRSGAWRVVLSREQVARVIADHGAVMRRFGYLDETGRPI